MENQIKEYPIVVLNGLTVVPTTTVHFDVKREESIKAIDASLRGDQMIFMITVRDAEKEIDKENLYSVGVVCKVRQILRLPKGVVRVLVEARHRGEFVEMTKKKPYYKGNIRAFSAAETGCLEPTEEKAYLDVLKDILKQFQDQDDKLSQAVIDKLREFHSLDELLYATTEYIGLSYDKKQLVLGTIDYKEQLETLISLAKIELQIRKIKDDLNVKTREVVSDNQKEYVLREQMRVIRKELGEDNTSDDAKDFLERLDTCKCPEEVKEKLQRDIKRFSNISSMSSESTVLRTYIETLLTYPWGIRSKISENLKKAIQVLEKDHYGLDKVKERVIDTLAVQMLSKDVQAPIICLVGPPGTGKSSIARSIASATNRKYERFSLGGVRDEAEIRGHRKTYVGAMPGRIATAMMHAKVENPLILLDEVDKVSKDYKGDTASALLEVLDSEQNFSFVDHYFEVPIDLSNVLFIATANDASNIPKPLLDRMEIIEVNSYTENEKLHIAKLYLIKKQMQKNGLTGRQFQIEPAALESIISSYTKEAGVRTLERTIGKLCQKAARKIVLGEQKSLRVTTANLETLLGPVKYRKEDQMLEDKIGSVTGLAWTAVGGDTLEVEVNVLDGKGSMKLTGNLGDVMKESAEIAFSHVKSLVSSENEACEEFVPKKLKKSYFEKHDLHVHVPEGATPKDGPSAGITMVTAIYSAVTGATVRGDVAMTGEVTLRGLVLPIGGLKEKLLAAKQAGKTEVLVPEKNRPNVAEIDEEIVEGMTITYVSNTRQVLKHALRSSNED